MSAIRNGLLFSLVFSIWVRFPASGAVVAGGDSGHTSAPANDPGWDYVGKVGGEDGNGSGVYVGNGWVLTANHVSPKTSFVVGEETYDILPGSANTYRLRNTADTADIDLYMFRVDVPVDSGLHSLPDLPIATSLPDNGTDGTHIGTGFGQTSSAFTTWWVDTGQDPWQWETEEFGGYTGNAYGYYWDTDSRETRWNYQRMYNNDYDFFGMEGFTTSFESIAGYGMATGEDSGSPIFFEDDDIWYLSGIAIALLNYPNQPSQTAMFGNQVAYADLTAYQDQITNTRLIPEPSAALFVVLAGAVFTIRRRVRQNRRGYESAALREV